MKKLQLILAVAIVALVSSCAVFNGKTTGKKSELEATKWQIEELNGKDIEAQDASYTLYFMEDNTLSAIGACNRITGNYLQERGSKLTCTLMASTRMMCPDMDTEAKFLLMLESVDGYKLTRKELHLYDEKQVIAKFKMIE